MEHSQIEDLTTQFPRFFELKKALNSFIQDRLPSASGLNTMVIEGIGELWRDNCNCLYAIIWLSVLDHLPQLKPYRFFTAFGLDCIERLKWISCQTYDDTVFPVRGNKLAVIEPGYRLLLADGIYTLLLENLSEELSLKSSGDPGYDLWSDLICEEIIFSRRSLLHDKITLREENVFYHLDMLDLLKRMNTRVSERESFPLTWSTRLLDGMYSFWEQSFEGVQRVELTVDTDTRDMTEGQKEWEQRMLEYFKAILSAGYLTFGE